MWLKISEEFDKIKSIKRPCVTGETRITAREHMVSKPFAWAEVREVFLTSFCLSGGRYTRFIEEAQQKVPLLEIVMYLTKRT
jgi:hypothetical protein